MRIYTNPSLSGSAQVDDIKGDRVGGDGPEGDLQLRTLIDRLIAHSIRYGKPIN